MNNTKVISTKVQSRRAIAMVELIFAIVIIGITLLSIPNLIYQASESGYTTIQQESIAAAASDLSLILSREWDENGTGDEYHTPILTTDAGTSSLGTTTGPFSHDSRPGASSRSLFTNIGGPYPASALGDDANDFDDIDDVAGVTDGQLTLIDGGQDLIDINISIATDVNYTSDATASGDWATTAATSFNYPTATNAASTNIKKVTVTLTTTSTVEEFADKKIVFNAFSTNIGSYKLERRELP